MLAVWLFSLSVRTFHIHHDSVQNGDSCYECSHHLKHPAHFSSETHAGDNCLICHILTVPFLCQKTTFIQRTDAFSNIFVQQLPPMTDRTVISQTPRAPPSSSMA